MIAYANAKVVVMKLKRYIFIKYVFALFGTVEGVTVKYLINLWLTLAS